jgi:hypothetical protein
MYECLQNVKEKINTKECLSANLTMLLCITMIPLNIG